MNCFLDYIELLVFKRVEPGAVSLIKVIRRRVGEINSKDALLFDDPWLKKPVLINNGAFKEDPIHHLHPPVRHSFFHIETLHL